MLYSREMPKLLSILIPMYNEEEAFPYLKSELSEWLDKFGCDVEVVLVDDGSTDKTLKLAMAWAEENERIIVVVLSRNFGHQLAITAGLDAVAGDAVVIMDADLQDPIEVITTMLERYCEGYDVAYGKRTEREGETIFKRVTADIFYWMMKKLMLENLPSNTGDFRLISRDVVDELRRLGENGRFIRGLTTWVGFDQIAVPYTRKPRAAGRTKYPLLKMIKFAADAIFSFSDLPLRFFVWIGMMSIMASVFMIIYTFYLVIQKNEGLVVGWSSIVVLISFLSGMTLLSTGMMGLYIGRIYTEVKNRPLYIVKKTFNIERGDLGKR